MAIKRYVGLGKESVYLEPIAASRWIETITSTQPNNGWVIPTPISQREFRKKNLGPFRQRGNIGPFDVEPENIGEILLGNLGSVQTTNPYAGVYLHTFKPADTLPSYTVRIGADIKERVLPGGLFNSLSLKNPHGQNTQATVEALSGAQESLAALATPTLSPLQAFNFLAVSAVNSILINGIERKGDIYDWEVKINNNIPFDRGALNNPEFWTKRVGSRDITGSLSMYFDIEDIYNLLIGGAEFPIIIQCGGPIIASTYRYSYKILLPKCVFTSGAPNVVPQNEPIPIADAGFKAFYDSSSQYDVQIELQNAIASY